MTCQNKTVDSRNVEKERASINRGKHTAGRPGGAEVGSVVVGDVVGAGSSSSTHADQRKKTHIAHLTPKHQDINTLQTEAHSLLAHKTNRQKPN